VNKKHYCIDYDLKAELVVEIDHDVMTAQGLREINDFWVDSKHRLEMARGDLLRAVLTLLGQVVMRIQAHDPMTTEGVIEEFNSAKPGGGIEGWPRMDGSMGIRIVDVDCFDFDAGDFMINEVAA